PPLAWSLISAYFLEQSSLFGRIALALRGAVSRRKFGFGRGPAAPRFLRRFLTPLERRGCIKRRRLRIAGGVLSGEDLNPVFGLFENAIATAKQSNSLFEPRQRHFEPELALFQVVDDL